jgi:hypothetical protein
MYFFSENSLFVIYLFIFCFDKNNVFFIKSKLIMIYKLVFKKKYLHYFITIKISNFILTFHDYFGE